MLSDEKKDQTRLNVRDIPAKLSAAGYIIIPAYSNNPPFNFSARDLDELAQAEHDLWLQAKRNAGWTYGPETNMEMLVHNCMLPWEIFPEVEKEKDRDMVRAIPMIIARAGYTIIKSESK